MFMEHTSECSGSAFLSPDPSSDPCQQLQDSGYFTTGHWVPDPIGKHKALSNASFLFLLTVGKWLEMEFGI